MAQMTKQALKDALIQLLDQEPLDKITIKDIVEQCDLNRNTFYYHFQDIYDLVDYLFVSEAERLIELDNKMSYLNWEDGLMSLTDYLTTHKRMIYHIYFSVSWEQLETYLYRVMDRVLYKVLKANCAANIDEERLRLYIDFYKYAFVGKIIEWIKEGMNEDPKQMIDRIKIVFEPTMDALIKN